MNANVQRIAPAGPTAASAGNGPGAGRKAPRGKRLARGHHAPPPWLGALAGAVAGAVARAAADAAASQGAFGDRPATTDLAWFRRRRGYDR